jgi:hypothetical protein
MRKYKPNKTRIVNKLVSLALIIIGIMMLKITDGDWTYLALSAPLILWLFFSRRPLLGV